MPCFLQYIFSSPPITYLFKKHVNIILTTSFFLLALGDLAAASFTEDKFGVVQRNIPDILMAFTQLQKVSFDSMHLFNLLT